MNIPRTWTFKSAEVAKGFDAHVREQLPWYDTVSKLVATIAKHFMPVGGVAYDIGASTGNMSRLLSDEIADRNVHWTSIDNSTEMKDWFRGHGELTIADAMTYDFEPFDLAICFLSMMFFPAKGRRRWLDRLISKINPQGAIIIVDKQESESGIVSTAIHRFTMGIKSDNGATPQDILKKELSLCGIQRPLPRNFFDGLNAVEVARIGDFAGWVIENRSLT